MCIRDRHVKQMAEIEAALAHVAIQGFADSHFKVALQTLADFAVKRNF